MQFNYWWAKLSCGAASGALVPVWVLLELAGIEFSALVLMCLVWWGWSTRAWAQTEQTISSYWRHGYLIKKSGCSGCITTGISLKIVWTFLSWSCIPVMTELSNWTWSSSRLIKIKYQLVILFLVRLCWQGALLCRCTRLAGVGNDPYVSNQGKTLHCTDFSLLLNSCFVLRLLSGQFLLTFTSTQGF